MGSLEERAVLEFETASLDSEHSIGRKQQSINGLSTQKCLSNGSLDNIGPNNLPKNSVLDSIKIVVFSAKINLLVPFGILAIVVDKVSGNQVSQAFIFVVCTCFIWIVKLLCTLYFRLGSFF